MTEKKTETTFYSGVMEVPQSSCGSNHRDLSRIGGKSELIPYIKILEQPAYDQTRFRYKTESENKNGEIVTIGSIPGITSTKENKTLPKIQIERCLDPVVVVVSCVTKDKDTKGRYHPHPHKLVGGQDCKDGICRVLINNEEMTHTFDHLGIQCVKKNEVLDSLKLRESRNVDPFRTGFNNTSIDMSSVRLCFQAVVKKSDKTIALEPAVSEPIQDKKSMTKLEILQLSHPSAPVTGNQTMILLCEKVPKDVEIWFYEERENGWEAKANFDPSQIHHHVAITFSTPKYKNLQVDHPVDVFIQLRQGNLKSSCRKFLLTPCFTDFKRKKISNHTNAPKCSNLCRSPANNILPSYSSRHISTNIMQQNPLNKQLQCSAAPLKLSKQRLYPSSSLFQTGPQKQAVLYGKKAVNEELTCLNPLHNLPCSSLNSRTFPVSEFTEQNANTTHFSLASQSVSSSPENNLARTNQYPLQSPPSRAQSQESSVMSPVNNLLNTSSQYIQLLPESKYDNIIPSACPQSHDPNFSIPVNNSPNTSSRHAQPVPGYYENVQISLTSLAQEQPNSIHSVEQHHPPTNTAESKSTAHSSFDGLMDIIMNSIELKDYQVSMDLSDSFSNLMVSQEQSSH